MISPRLPRASLATVVAVARVAAAQPPATAPHAPPAQISDDPQIAETLRSIAQDPAVPIDNPAIRPQVLALLTEGVKQRRARAFDQALANFLEAYARFPSPKILLEVASTLHDMGRLADAANTYQRYLTAPAAGPGRVAEVKELLLRLDEQLTILTVRVSPHGSEISIDGGPFIPVGSTLVTRVQAGLHLVRIRRDEQSDELTINGFDGENKQVTATLAAAPAERTRAATAPPERVDGWLITGTQYSTSDASGRARTVHRDGRELAASVPHREVPDRVEPMPDQDDDAIGSGVIGALRIDGKGRGFAAGAGLAISRGQLELDILVLKSDEVGGYLGARYRPLTGVFRPYAALGAPGFAYDHQEDQIGGMTQTTTRLAIGVRVAAGVELKINGHVSVQGDLGYEHFFFVDDHFEADVFVPTVGVIGRL